MARKWNEEEEHLLRVLVKNNKKTSEISQEFEEMHSKNLPGFKTLRSKDSIRKKCDRDNLNTETLKSYHSPYEDRWNYIKELTKEFKE